MSHFVNKVIFLIIFFFPQIGFSSPYGKPVEEDLPKAPVIMVGHIRQAVGNGCLIIDSDFFVKGEIQSDGVLFCLCCEYKNELYIIENIINFYKRDSKSRFVFLMRKGDEMYNPAFHAYTIGYFNKDNCIVFPGVVDESTGKYIMETSQKFFSRFEAKIPNKFRSHSDCQNW